MSARWLNVQQYLRLFDSTWTNRRDIGVHRLITRLVIDVGKVTEFNLFLLNKGRDVVYCIITDICRLVVA